MAFGTIAFGMRSGKKLRSGEERRKREREGEIDCNKLSIEKSVIVFRYLILFVY